MSDSSKIKRHLEAKQLTGIRIRDAGKSATYSNRITSNNRKHKGLQLSHFIICEEMKVTVKCVMHVC